MHALAEAALRPIAVTFCSPNLSRILFHADIALRSDWWCVYLEHVELALCHVETGCLDAEEPYRRFGFTNSTRKKGAHLLEDLGVELRAVIGGWAPVMVEK